MGRAIHTRPAVRAAIAASALALLAASPAPAADGPARGPGHLAELDSALLGLRGGDDSAIRDARSNLLTVSAKERVLVDVYVSGPVEVAAAGLEAAGMSVSGTAPQPFGIVEGWIPATALGAASELGATDAVAPVPSIETDAGSILSQSVAAHRIPQATSTGAATGANSDVGVISNSINRAGAGVAGSQATGDLPAATSVIKDGLPGDNDEGRAMAEIIYDEAPGLRSLMFASGTNVGPVDKADSIDKLVAAGADVIADDISVLNEPFFQDGVVTAAADRARAAGVLYFASAGNRARQSWEGFYADSGPSDDHDFNPGAGVDALQNLVTLPGDPDGAGPQDGSAVSLFFDWDEPLGGVTTDMDIFLVTPAGGPLPGTPPAGGTADSIANGRPIEIVSWRNTTAAPVQVAVRIDRFSGSRSPFLKYIAREDFAGSFTVAEYPTNSNTINPDAAAAKGAIAVAAVASNDPGLNTPETFSSRGPMLRLFDVAGNRLAVPEVRLKPEVAAADRVSTTVPGFNPFSGTSAAAPSAAGIAAVLLSSNPDASLEEVEEQMTDPLNGIECTSSVLTPDPDCGAGFLLADLAYSRLDKNGPVITAALSPRRPDGRGPWYTRPVTITWNVADAESAVLTGCPTVVDHSDGTERFSCASSSGGGPATGSVTVKRDTVKPSKPKLKGIKPRAYRQAKLPKRSKVKCRSKDRTSGLQSCKVKGYGRKPGKHVLVATATDKAGLKAVTRFKYRVLP